MTYLLFQFIDITRFLHSFPTRRSSDLRSRPVGRLPGADELEACPEVRGAEPWHGTHVVLGAPQRIGLGDWVAFVQPVCVELLHEQSRRVFPHTPEAYQDATSALRQKRALQ